jgi:MoxR-like ATPase
LGYPTRETEIEIIKVNAPAYDLPEDVLNKIYEIVNDTRGNPDLEIPASPRAGIYLTRLVDKYRERFDDTDKAIRFFSPSVLAKEMRVRNTQKTVEGIVEEILANRLG